MAKEGHSVPTKHPATTNEDKKESNQEITGTSILPTQIKAEGTQSVYST